MSETFVPDKLFAGVNSDIVPGEVTVVTGEGALARGSVLGKVTASGKYRLVDATAIDGSEAPDCILGEAVDATAADAVGGAYFTGEFNEEALIFGGGDDADTHRDALRAKGIFLRTNVPA